MATVIARNAALLGVRCRACGTLQPADTRYVCAECMGPIEPEYDTAALARDGTRARIQSGPQTLWRYAPLLPCAPAPGAWPTGWTALVPVPRLGAALGIDDLWIKDDTRNLTLSFKDRPVAVASARAVEQGCTALACASTGNLAGSVAAAAARLGLPAYVFVPAETEPAKVMAAATYGATVVRVNGSYDRVNRLCATLADDRSSWGFVNFTLRPYYAEGSKTMLFEIAEQNGWRLPDHVIVPVGSGALLTRTATAAAQLVATGLVPETPMRISAAQPAGCAPVSDAILDDWRAVRPVREAKTIAKSLAIGAPADGDGSVAVVKRTGGSAASVSDEDIVEACSLAARTEGISVEPAGGTVVATARALARRGVFRKNERVVLYLTGNGYKQGAAESLPLGPAIAPDVDEFLAAYPQARA
ncbi:MAG: threonine synthase [Chloroflexi bacterium]|nr:threonine synthase [Chloroflexota bacterium]